ncbi:UNVERIFIED_CONTAM: hypothetical protein Scaly_1489000 [Sesamum calycinum]|uniref:Uncharacterized protein n=1 Tax=Sesamum calycinum TaxID=2727403 RepID=A0AAW2PQ21_9LAMI
MQLVYAIEWLKFEDLGLILEDPYKESTSSETRNAESDESRDENGGAAVSSGKNTSQVDTHTDVAEADGMIIIPYKEVPDNWTEAPDILSFRSLDRSFVFPGEQIRILACLSGYKQETEIITPFKVAAVMNKNGKSPQKANGNVRGQTNSVSEKVDASPSDADNQHNETVIKGKIDSHKVVSTGESLLRMEDHERQTQQLLQRFKNSHFFARIAESNEPLWSNRRALEACLESSATLEEQLTGDSSETATTTKNKNHINAVIDKGNFDARTSGGLARGAECWSLSNGDIVVLLQVTVGVQFIRDPILEILQFEKYQERELALNQDIPTSLNRDPSDELLKWLLPLDNSIPPPARPLSPPTLSSSSSIRSTPTKPAVSGSSSSQLFSFGHFRSQSMSSLPPNMTPPQAVTTPNAKPTFDPEDWNQFSFNKFVESGKSGNEGLLSFRGVPLQQERFSVRCGLEGIYTPGRRWRRKIELIQPVEIHTFSVDCNTDDLLCVHVKNAVAIVFEEPSKSGPPFFLPMACIESGNNCSLPNLALRSGEEHSFILKPAVPSGSMARVSLMVIYDHHAYHLEMLHQAGNPPNLKGNIVHHLLIKSKLFFKQPTSWRPRMSRDLMISVASEMSRQALGSDGNQLPVQVLTLQVSNMTSDNLTLTVLAPASFTSLPSVVPLSNSFCSPFSPFSASAELGGRVNIDRQGAVMVHRQTSLTPSQGQKVEDGPLSVSNNERTVPISDVVPKSDPDCTHLWLQSRVPLGYVLLNPQQPSSLKYFL